MGGLMKPSTCEAPRQKDSKSVTTARQITAREYNQALFWTRYKELHP